LQWIKASHDAFWISLTAASGLWPALQGYKFSKYPHFLNAVPAVAILVMAMVALRHFRRVDEFIRRPMVECFAAAGAFTLTWTLAYGVFELASLPKISMWRVFAGMVVIWNLSLPLAVAIGKAFGRAVEEIFGNDSRDARGGGSAKSQSQGKAKNGASSKTTRVPECN
jgi:hypothetical protein